MIKLKFALIFAVMVGVTGIFPKTAKAQTADLQNLGIYCYTCRYNPTFPPLGEPKKPSLIYSLYMNASDASDKQNYAAAFQIYTKIISLDAQQAQAYFNRGGVRQSELNDRAGAMRDFRIAEKLFRQQGNDYMTRASIRRINQLLPSTKNNYQTRQERSRNNNTRIEQLRSEQIACANKVKRRFGYNNGERLPREDPNFLVIARSLQDECVTPFLSK